MLVPLAHAEASSFAPACPYLSAPVQSLLALRPDGCRWRVGDLNQETFGFCGATRLKRASYCAPHKALSCEGVR